MSPQNTQPEINPDISAEKRISDRIKSYINNMESSDKDIDFEAVYQDIAKNLDKKDLALLLLHMAAITFEIIQNDKVIRARYIEPSIKEDPSIQDKPLFNLLTKLMELDMQSKGKLDAEASQKLRESEEKYINSTDSTYQQFISQYHRKPYWIEGMLLSYIALHRGKELDYLEIYRLMQDEIIEKPYATLWRSFFFSASLIRDETEAYREENDQIDMLLREGRKEEAFITAIQIAQNIPPKHKIKGLKKLLEKVSPVQKTPQDSNESAHFSIWHHTMAQILFMQGETENISHYFELAKKYHLESLEGCEEDEENGLCYIHLSYGHYLHLIGQEEAALSEFKQAWECASIEDIDFAASEYGSVLLECNKPVEAAEVLKTVKKDYENIDSVKVRLAECYYALGKFEKSKELLIPLVSEGSEIVASNMILGYIEFDYYDLEQSLYHFSKVIEHTNKGTGEWFLGHQMIAEIMAQQGFKQPQQILMHINWALDGLNEDDEWHNTLIQYKEKALSMINTQLN